MSDESAIELKTITVDGVSFEVDPELINDWDFMEPLSEVMAQQEHLDPSGDSSDPIAAGKAMVGLNEVAKKLFGNNFNRVKNELRERNGGRLPIETMARFVMQSVEELQKN